MTSSVGARRARNSRTRGEHLAPSGVDGRQDVAAVAELGGGPRQDVQAGQSDDADAQCLRQPLGGRHARRAAR